ncbi:MAG: methyltransferase domain-containing protein [Gemmatimonadota bacterium]
MSRYERVVDLASDSTHSRVLRLVGRDRRVLEFGCASGYMSRVLTEELGCRVVGVEIDPEAAASAERFCERVIAGDCEALEYEALFGPGAFDVLLFADVLEHLKRPRELLRRVRPLLAAGGRVVASVPNFAHASVLLHVLHGRLEYRELGLLDETHLRFFTRENLLATLEQAGYSAFRLERQRLDPRRSEVGADVEALPPAVVEHVLAGPESDVYQFVVAAVPVEDAGHPAGATVGRARSAVPELEVLDPLRGDHDDPGSGSTLERLAAFEEENADLAESRTTLLSEVAALRSAGEGMRRRVEGLESAQGDLALSLRAVTSRLEAQVGRTIEHRNRARELDRALADSDARARKLERAAATAQSELDALRRQIEAIRLELVERELRLRKAETERTALQDHLERVFASRIWRWTRPVRVTVGAWRDRSRGTAARSEAGGNGDESDRKGGAGPPPPDAGGGAAPGSADGPSAPSTEAGGLGPVRHDSSVGSLATPDPARVRDHQRSLVLAAPPGVAARWDENPPPLLEAPVSIVIPTKDAGEEFDLVLGRLRDQRGVRIAEIVVVDSGSSDASPARAERHGCQVVHIPAHEFTHSHARNLGVAHTTGEFVLVMTQDALPLGDRWLHTMLRCLLDHADEGLVALSCTEYPRSDCDLLYGSMIYNHYEFLGCRNEDRLGELVSTDHHALRVNGQLSDIACLIRRDVLVRYGYRGAYGEDLDLGMRLIRDGHRVAMLSSVKVVHSHTRPAFYFLKRGYVDSIFLGTTFPDYGVPQVPDVGPLFHSILQAFQRAEAVGSAVAALGQTTLAGLYELFHETLARPQAKGRVAREADSHEPSLAAFLAWLGDRQSASSGHAHVVPEAVAAMLDAVRPYLERPYAELDAFLLGQIPPLVEKLTALTAGAYLGYLQLGESRRGRSPIWLADLRTSLNAGI